ncbi:MAG: YjgP/YjgQ family permease [Calditrichaeota bacterium]|nr:MAG: YjgP/YjgQ family permease [Calditrichota bacterium]
MFLLARYTIREHIGPFFFSLAVIMFVFVTKFIVQYIGKIFGKGLSLLTIFEFVYLNLAWMFALAVPMAVLVASLMAFGRLSSDNEITILKTSGISLYKIIQPVLIITILLTIFMYWFNDQLLPEYNHKARLLFSSISRKKPTLQLEQGIYMTMGKYSILVQDIERSLGKEVVDKSNILSPEYADDSADRLKDITIFDRSSVDRQRTIIARRGRLVFDRSRERLVFTLFDGEIHEVNTQDYSEYRRLQFAINNFYIPAPELVFRKEEDEYRSDREMSVAMMQHEVDKYRQSIEASFKTIEKFIKDYYPHPDSLQQLLALAGNNSDSISLSFDKLQSARSRAIRKVQAIIQRVESEKNNISFFRKQIYKFQVEIHKKFSIPFASIVFVLIGTPLGIKAKKGSLGVGVTFSIGFFLLYWVFLIGGEELADRQLLSPFLAMWLPNIIVGSFGVYLTYRVVKETTFIRWEKLPRFLQLFFKGDEQNQ